MIFLQYALGIIALITFVPLSVGLASARLIDCFNPFNNFSKRVKKKGRLSAPNL